MTKRALGIAIALLMMANALFIGIIIEDEVSGAPTREAPSVPLNFAAESMNNQIKLTWDHPASDGDSDRIGYVLRRGLNTDDLEIRKSDFGPFNTQFVDASVTNGVNYYYDIAAINEFDGVGQRTDLITEKPVGPAAPPLNFSAEYSSGVVDLDWEAPSYDGGDDIIGYRIMKGPTRTQLDTFIDIPVQISYTDNDVTNGVSYYYQIRASNNYVVNGSMPPEPLQVTPRGKPLAPGDLNVTRKTNGVHLNWTYPSDDGGGSVMRYNVYRGLDLESVDLYFSPIGLNTEYLDTNITNGISYYYSISALNMEGEGEGTEIQMIRPVGAPDSPMNLTVSPGDTEAYLSWKPPENDGGIELEGYNIYRTTKGVEMELIAEIGVVLEFTDDNLTNGNTYYYQVRGRNALGAGLPSRNEETKPDFLPDAPSNFRVKEFEGYIQLLWAHPPMSLDYPVQQVKLFKGIVEDSLTYLATLNSTIASFNDDDVEVGIAYYYMIRSYSEIGEGPGSGIITGIPYSAPSLIRDPQVEPLDNLVKVIWTPPEFSGGREIVNYKIYRGETREGLSVLVTLPGTTTLYNDTNVDNGVTYYYSIMPVNEMREGNLSGPIEAKPLGPPTSPRNLVTSIDVDVIVLEWEQPRSNGGRPITGFVILRGPSKFNLSQYEQVGIVYNFTDADVEKGVEYFYGVIAVNDVGEGKQSTPSGTEIYLDRSTADKEQDMTPLIIGGIVVVVLIAALIAFVVFMTKRKEKQEEDGAQEFEESDKEKEHRLVLERRKEMEEFTDVALNTAQAHAHDHDEHSLSYEDLYGNSSNEEAGDEVASGEVAPPEQEEAQPTPPDYQPPPEEEIAPQAQPAPIEEPTPEGENKEEVQGEYIPPEG